MPGLMVSEFVVVWVELNWLRDVAGSAFFCEKGRLTGWLFRMVDMIRSLKHDNYLVMETQAQGFPCWTPYKGQLRLCAYSHLVNLKKKNDVAVMVSNEALTALNWFGIQATSGDNGEIRYNDVVRWIYDALYRMNSHISLRMRWVSAMISSRFRGM